MSKVVSLEDFRNRKADPVALTLAKVKQLMAESYERRFDIAVMPVLEEQRKAIVESIYKIAEATTLARTVGYEIYTNDINDLPGWFLQHQ